MSLILIAVALIVSNPSEKSHRGAIYKLEKRTMLTITDNGLTASEFWASLQAEFLMKSMDKNYEYDDENHRKRIKQEMTNIFKDLRVKHYDLKLLSISIYPYKHSLKVLLGISGYLVAADIQNKRTIILNATEGEFYYEEQKNKKENPKIKVAKYSESKIDTDKDDIREAIKELKQTKKEYGGNHILTTTKMSTLAHLYSRQGNLKDAEKYYKQTLKAYNKMGSADEKSATLMNLASLYQDQQKYFKAEQLLLKSLKLLEDKNASPDSLFYTENIKQLAEVYRATGELDKAQLYEHRVKILK